MNGREVEKDLLASHKLLVANRGEIAIRVLRTAKRLGLYTIAVYTQVDATSPHVTLADEAVPLISSKSGAAKPEDESLASNALAYLDAQAVLKACLDRGATMVHPGYGFLSENAEFARLLHEHEITLLGPSVATIERMGLKHRARAIAKEAQVPIVPGSEGLVESVEEAAKVAGEIGYPVMLKADAGGGGMGLIVCKNEDELRKQYPSSQQRAKSLFHNEGLFIEKYFETSRHIEIQIFGDGQGHVIHMGERECSVQRRHQKIIEESPSPFLFDRLDMRDRMCEAAVRLGTVIKYKSAGTVEFIVDDTTSGFFFLEMNTRLQVEHGVTEMLHPGLDLVELMILQGLADTNVDYSITKELDQQRFEFPSLGGHAIEVRVYCENPSSDFCPSPGVLQHVDFPDPSSDVRIDTWVTSGTTVSPFYDPLIAKIIVQGHSREAVLETQTRLLRPAPGGSDESEDKSQRIIVQGPPNNIPFLRQVLQDSVFKDGRATTQWIDSGGIDFRPSSFTIISPGISASIQSFPYRSIGLGVPPSGPMDSIAFQAGNILVGNPIITEGIEIVVPPQAPILAKSLAFVAHFYADAVVAVTGAACTVTIDGEEKDSWARLSVPAGGKLTINGPFGNSTQGGGLRAYLSIFGGLPGIPEYLGSKSTSMGFGGYQGRELQKGDLLDIIPATMTPDQVFLAKNMIPQYPSQWTLFSLPGPHDDEEFLTEEGIEAFYARSWRVSAASNRMGIRLEPILSAEEERSGTTVIDWARKNGGEGGSHPSNILDNGYARGSVNLNGDTPVILTLEGPDMGGYLCATTIASADQWKLGQLRPGDEVKFFRIAHEDAMRLHTYVERWMKTMFAIVSGFNTQSFNLLDFLPRDMLRSDPKLFSAPATAKKPKLVIRQAGDSGLLVEYGEMTLDFDIRARIHALELKLKEMQVPGIARLCPCIRSTMLHYDPFQIDQDEVIETILTADEMLPDASEDMTFPGRKLTFPIVLDDKWSKEALERYMHSIRDKAAYLPSNIEYLARNNGVEGGAEEALRMLVKTPWLVFGVGFYLGCPFLVPIDPRCRLVGQKMNPSRIYTPRGAIGMAGPVGAIYPVESPGGYQLFGRTIPTWQAWGRGKHFSSTRPWLLEPFDQVSFEPVSEDTYAQLEKDFDNGQYIFKIENVIFSMKDYTQMITETHEEVLQLRKRQQQGVAAEEKREDELLKDWQERKRASSAHVNTTQAAETSHFVSSPLSGSLWKLKCTVGDTLKDPDQVLLILEAMKTEIPVVADEDFVGMKVASIPVAEGDLVKSGDKLVYFE